jgi:hypothetical protein
MKSCPKSFREELLARRKARLLGLFHVVSEISPAQRIARAKRMLNKTERTLARARQHPELVDESWIRSLQEAVDRTRGKLEGFSSKQKGSLTMDPPPGA